MSVTTDIFFCLFEFIEKEIDGDDQQKLPKNLTMFLSKDAKHEARYALSKNQQQAYKWIIEAIESYDFPQTTVYRAQVGVCWSMPEFPEHGLVGINKDVVQTAEQSLTGREPLPEKRMVPNATFVSDGRANARGIPVLYCAGDIHTALLEVRAPVGSACTVAQFRNSTRLRLADMREPNSRNTFTTFSEAKKCLKDEIAYLFSKRVVGDAGVQEYMITQHISEHIRQGGYDGIIYSSSQGEGDNYAFFDVTKLELTKREMYEIDNIKISVSPLPETEQFNISEFGVS